MFFTRQTIQVGILALSLNFLTTPVAWTQDDPLPRPPRMEDGEIMRNARLVLAMVEGYPKLKSKLRSRKYEEQLAEEAFQLGAEEEAYIAKKKIKEEQDFFFRLYNGYGVVLDYYLTLGFTDLVNQAQSAASIDLPMKPFRKDKNYFYLLLHDRTCLGGLERQP